MANQPEKTLGDKPELKWIPITKLYVDPSYQRSAKSRASASNLNYLKANFAWAHCGGVDRLVDAGKAAVCRGGRPAPPSYRALAE